eukprot:TRINITY_DN41555_c0_g1_i1.p1 TRINITY_DN41555_c0_g1~~TRINITY_DN41555_c0_g1_i1.p1  ORF type:complete len:114 (-),score=29.76 TRINITY_DN41555_c0_g1_i1:126-467(-)
MYVELSAGFREDRIFFFFKQKTAYEMLRSLVGSEMCIRDRDHIKTNSRTDVNFSDSLMKPHRMKLAARLSLLARPLSYRIMVTTLQAWSGSDRLQSSTSVSYTHLTLPTKRIV